ncbi:uncharacterized protein LOC109428065 [Aedes albopictus]|uniref:DDE Tnp4 domain-containing protein n=1 Tax=Aedes albopictus TaxID=7160 RepID=A0ABM1ZZ66_AEDAL
MSWYDEIVDSAVAVFSLALGNEDEVAVDLLSNNSDNSPSTRGSRPGRRPNIDRNFGLGHRLLFDDYFREHPTYDEKHFIRRFRMTKAMFLMIVEDLKSHDAFFTLRCDAAGKIGLSPIQKCTAALRMLAYGSSASSLDENIRIGESTTLLNLRKFCESIITVYGPKFLRPPNQEEVQTLMEENTQRGFPGMVASIDCMHWAWKNCPVALKGQYQGKEGKATIVLEVFASKTTYIWHSFFGCPGSCNDINVLDRSPLINDIVENKMLDGQWEMNGKTYSKGYLLADGIYPDWPIFMKTISHPQTAKAKLYAKRQESVRKDVERCFGILQACWQILVNPCRLFDEESMRDIITTCIILHNMRIHFKHSNPELRNQVENVHPDMPCSGTAGFSRVPQRTFNEMCEDRNNIRNAQRYYEMRNELVDHLWMTKGVSQLD